MEFLLLIVSLWVIFRLVGSAFKAGENISSGAPSGAGWVYVIERDGYLKVGGFKYDNNGLVKDLSRYVNSDVVPKDSKVNLVYYNFFDNFSKKESLLLEFLTGISDKYKESLLSKNRTKDGEPILQLIKVPEKTHWFQYDGNYNEIYGRIISWFNHSGAASKKKYGWLIGETNDQLQDWNKMFLQKLPEAK